jgi:hypothetical protein
VKVNPDPLPGERGLAMRYSDPFQFFLFAPWTGFPVSMQGKADFSGANLLPIVDVVGFRHQFGGSRVGDIRVGLGATALSFTAKQEQTLANGDVVVEDKPQLRMAPEFNIGLANLKVGVAYALSPLKPDQNVRILVGADLLKLITGQNVEAF